MRRFTGPLVLAALVMAFFGHVLFGNRIFLYRDLFSFHYPLHHYWVSALQKGTLPALNPAVNGGQPILTNPNNAVFYPLNILYVLLPFDVAWNLTFTGHVLWAAIGLY